MNSIRSFFSIIAIGAIMISATFSGCKSSKPTASATTEPTASQRAQQMKEEAELIKAQQALEDARAEAARATQQREANAAISAEAAQRQAARLAASTEQPCQIYDDAEWYTGVGTRVVKQNSINTSATALLRSTQQQLRQKIQGQYKAVVRDYFDQMDTDQGSYADSHIESAGDMVINRKVNDTYEVCRRNTEPDASGNITIYMAIKVSKKEIVDDIVKEISKDKQLEVRFKEDQFRKSAFKVFEQDQKQSYQDYKTNQQ